MPKVGMEPIRKKQVIDAVLKCIANEGIEKVTLDKTAQTAGISKGVVVYYFRTKENLIFRAFEAFLKNYMEMPEGTEAIKDEDLTACEILLYIGQIVLGLIPSGNDLNHKESKTVLLQMYSRLSLSAEFRDMVRKVYDEYLDSFVKILEWGMEKKEFSLEDSRRTAVELLALLEGLIIFSILEFQGNSHDQYEKYCDFVMRLS